MRENRGKSPKSRSTFLQRRKTLGRRLSTIIPALLITILLVAASNARAGGDSACKCAGCATTCSCTPASEPVDIYDVQESQKYTTISLSWNELPAGVTTTLSWSNTNLLTNSMVVSGSGSYSVPSLRNVEPDATTYFSIEATPPAATCTVTYTEGTYGGSFYVSDSTSWVSPGITSNGFSGAPPSSGLCSGDLGGGGGGASSSPNPPSVADSPGTTEFELTATADTCAIWQITGTGGFYTPEFAPTWPGQYTFTYAWTINWNSAFDCFVGPFSTAGSQGNLQILGNMINVSSSSDVSSSNVVMTIVSWDWAIGCLSGSSGDQLYSVALTANLGEGFVYSPFSYVSSWIYTLAAGDASAQAIMNVGSGGDYATLSWVSLVYDGN
jgi:hypothetical protein